MSGAVGQRAPPTPPTTNGGPMVCFVLECLWQHICSSFWRTGNGALICTSCRSSTDACSSCTAERGAATGAAPSRNPGQSAPGGQPHPAPHPQCAMAVCRHHARLPGRARHSHPLPQPALPPAQACVHLRPDEGPAARLQAAHPPLLCGYRGRRWASC